MNTSVEKIDVEELINDFKVFNAEAFQTYLTGVWKDLASRSDNKYKGINKITLSKYYELPGIIFDRLFSVLDSSKTEYINLDEFINGMMTLFTKSFDDLVKFIFQFYDFDKDGKICKEDIRIVLSYVPLNRGKIQKKTNTSSEFNDRIESQDELHNRLDSIFKKDSSINEQEFIKIVENFNSDIFLYILIFLLEKRPFNSQTIKLLENIKKSPSILDLPKSPGGKMIASPTLNSIFEPSVTINKSPSLNKSPRNIGGAPQTLQNQMEKKQNQVDYLKQIAGGASIGTIKPKTKAAAPKFRPNVNMKKEETHTAPMRKLRHTLQDLDQNITEKKFEGDDDIPLQFARRFETKKNNVQEGDDKSLSSDDDNQESSQTMENEENQKGNFSGYIYKITHRKKLKKIWFRLIYKDLYYYKSSEDAMHKGMHNLSGVFVKEEPECVIEGKHLFSFSIINPMKSRKYYVEDEKEFKEWLNNLRKAIGYSDLNDIYEIKGKLGKGKFGLVRLGINKLTKEKVAIKIMSKNNMSTSDLEQVKTEIEILKVANHPNIIRLYDEFENMEYIYIIMEYCSGGDLFSYLEKRKFALPEERAALIIQKLSAAIYFLHEYGIVHRDLKPENILMTDNTDVADIKLLDFGLGKMIGPNETCIEAFGTLSYVSPEVLQEKPYGKGVDLWAIGIIAYLLVSGFLPFDDENSEKEIARQTLQDPVPYPPSIWRKISSEAKQFIDTPEKRMSIKEVLEHPWLEKFCGIPLQDKENSSMKGGDVFKIYSNPDQKNTLQIGNNQV